MTFINPSEDMLMEPSELDTSLIQQAHIFPLRLHLPHWRDNSINKHESHEACKGSPSAPLLRHQFRTFPFGRPMKHLEGSGRHEDFGWRKGGEGRQHTRRMTLSSVFGTQISNCSSSPSAPTGAYTYTQRFNGQVKSFYVTYGYSLPSNNFQDLFGCVKWLR